MSRSRASNKKPQASVGALTGARLLQTSYMLITSQIKTQGTKTRSTDLLHLGQGRRPGNTVSLPGSPAQVAGPLGQRARLVARDTSVEEVQE